MWRKVGLIGREKLLPELGSRASRKKASFLLLGPRGAGKTALLEWAYEQAPEPKAFISAKDSPRDSLLKIIRSWDNRQTIEKDGQAVALSRAKINDLERAVLQHEEGLIFIDDIQAATPTFINKLKVWRDRDRFIIYAAGVPPFKKEELKRNLWGIKTIELGPIPKKRRLELAEKVCRAVGSTESPRRIAQSCRGFPGRTVAMARGSVDEIGARTAEEEINIAPILLVGCAAVMAVRYIGRQMDSSTMVLIGGIGMAIAGLGRFFLMQGMRD